MMDYSVISQIIRITKEKKKEERQLGTLVSNYPLDSIVLGISQCGQKARLKGGMEREAQMVIYFFLSPIMFLILRPSDLVLLPTIWGVQVNDFKLKMYISYSFFWHLDPNLTAVLISYLRSI